MLEIAELHAYFGRAEAVRGVSLDVPRGRIVAVVGPNGAGKSTLAYAVCGLHAPRTGTVRMDGRDVSALRPPDIARAGLTLVPQGRRVFGSLTVGEHLDVAGKNARRGALSRAEVLEIFPSLGARRRVHARMLSGGEQQMLAIARAVLLGPAFIVLDEPTEGLAPAVVELVGALLRRLRDTDVGVLLMEQARRFPFDVADVVHSMDRGALASLEVQPA
jgi:branched-chain amino acid transport system ATP-binding protein